MKSAKTWLIVFAAAVLLALVVALFRSGTPEVRLAPVERGPVIDAVYATGEVRAIDRADVSAEVNGRVMSVLAREGDTVGEGEVLVKIETSRLELAQKMAENALERTKATWKEAERDLDRMKSLIGQRAVSKAEYDRAARHAERAKADYDRQKSALELESDRMVRAEVKSPMAGLIVSRNVDPGDYASVATVLLEVIDPSSLLVVVDVDETEGVGIAKGQPVKVSLDAYPGRVFSGTVEWVSPVIDRVTRTGEVRVKIIEGPPVIKEGMSATVNIITRRLDSALVVPRDAVTLGKDRARVFIVQDGKLAAVEFVPGAMDEDRIEVTSGGLEEGMMVVVSPDPDLGEGDEVSVADE